MNSSSNLTFLATPVEDDEGRLYEPDLLGERLISWFNLEEVRLPPVGRAALRFFGELLAGLDVVAFAGGPGDGELSGDSSEWMSMAYEPDSASLGLLHGFCGLRSRLCGYTVELMQVVYSAKIQT
ncbi:hypothetical protein LTR10_001024 [Elasticomyces elasticus]|nr:hypothetical protein LTR10_001024 [Elasticomyces elasticus]